MARERRERVRRGLASTVLPALAVEAALSLALYDQVQLGVSSSFMPTVWGLTLSMLGFPVALAAVAAWGVPNPWPRNPWVWLGVSAGLAAWFRLSPTNFVPDGDTSNMLGPRLVYLHLGPLRVLDGIWDSVWSPRAEFMGTNVLVLSLFGVWLAAAIAALWCRRRRPEVALGVAVFTPPFAFLNLHLNQRLFESAPTAVTWAGMGLAGAGFVVLAVAGLQLGAGDVAWVGQRVAGRLRGIRTWGY